VIEKEHTDAFRRFLTYLPHGKDLELVILKSHLLIEEKTRTLLTGNCSDNEALRNANLTCEQVIYMAKALNPEMDKRIWVSALKLNNIRNKIAHKVEHSGLTHQIEDFVRTSMAKYEDCDLQEKFELSLWSLFVCLSVKAEPVIN
jgi:hypothetical protein